MLICKYRSQTSLVEHYDICLYIIKKLKKMNFARIQDIFISSNSPT